MKLLAQVGAEIRQVAYGGTSDVATCGNPSIMCEINEALAAVHVCLANTPRSPQTSHIVRDLQAAMKYLRAIKAQNEPTTEPGDSFANFPILRFRN